jgi:rhamnosyltransferase
MNTLWKMMSCKKNIDFKKLSTKIMPWESMFWYRPKALQRLLNLNLSLNNTQLKLSHNTEAISHSIERMLVYIAWNEGYDYRIMTTESPNTINYLINNIVLNSEISQVQKSFNYKIGDFILKLPKAIIKLIKQ